MKRMLGLSFRRERTLDTLRFNFRASSVSIGPFHVVAIVRADLNDCRIEGLFQPPYDSRLVEVVGRYLHFHVLPDTEGHSAFAHLAANDGFTPEQRFFI
jgi:hypothetical protein